MCVRRTHLPLVPADAGPSTICPTQPKEEHDHHSRPPDDGPAPCTPAHHHGAFREMRDG